MTTPETPSPVTLLPCPFCGGPANGPSQEQNEMSYSYHAICCGSGCGVSVEWEDSAGCVAAWNRRAQPAAAATVRVPEGEVFAWFRRQPREWDIVIDSDLKDRPDPVQMLAKGWTPLGVLRLNPPSGASDPVAEFVAKQEPFGHEIESAIAANLHDYLDSPQWQPAQATRVGGWNACITEPELPALLRNPHTGTLRDYRDVESDPAGLLIVEPGAPLIAATPPLAELPALPVAWLHEIDWTDGQTERGVKLQPPKLIRDGGTPMARCVVAERVTPLGPIAQQSAAGVGVGGETKPAHYCPEWDYMQVQPGTPEMDACTCSFTPTLHPATRGLVERFSGALITKLAAAEKKYGYSDGWQRADWMDECRAKLAEHVVKGDPRDVAAYCAFLWHHGEPTAIPPAPIFATPPLVAQDAVERAAEELCGMRVHGMVDDDDEAPRLVDVLAGVLGEEDIRLASDVLRDAALYALTAAGYDELRAAYAEQGSAYMACANRWQESQDELTTCEASLIAERTRAEVAEGKVSELQDWRVEVSSRLGFDCAAGAEWSAEDIVSSVIKTQVLLHHDLVEAKADTSRLDYMAASLMREAQIKLGDGSMRDCWAWAISSATPDLRDAIDAALRAQASQPSGGNHGE